MYTLRHQNYLATIGKYFYQILPAVVGHGQNYKLKNIAALQYKIVDHEKLANYTRPKFSCKYQRRL